MNIPSRLAKLVENNLELQGSVTLTLHDFTIWFEDKNPVFFPEYTDHGPKHIQEVIKAAEALIRDESWKYLTPEDAAVLVLAILLHDCAMHLSEEGFIALVAPQMGRPIMPTFGDVPWPELWADFLAEASRFDGQKLKSIFGETEPIRRPPLEPQQMTYKDRLLIGEFLRRHHHRLAHEIALWGVPGPTDETLGLVKVPKPLDNIAGLVARSHGMNLRDSLETLPRDHRREYYKVHVPFLMTILRIADYIQIHSERAPQQILKIRSLKSPISEGEWKIHDVIEDIHCTHDDPEAIMVFAMPDNIKTYLKLRQLLTGLQNELDSSWAVLGETYGRVQGLSELGLTIRRIRSNLDNRREFAKTIAYYPDRIAFEADPEILKLLIDPLYGDTPSIGIRELIQNAVDAVREREDYLKNTFSQESLDEDLAEPNVMVHLEEEDKNGSGYVSVVDNGIGMTPDVIKNYFLKAGASFRSSDAWRELHESDPGKSRVLRSGRFGIGLLSAFLLGDRIEVKTRHVTLPEKSGIRFSCSIDDEEIELHHAKLPIGTSIRVKISKSTFKMLKDKKSDWEWYYLKNPLVERKITAQNYGNTELKTTIIAQSEFIPEVDSDLEGGWRRVRHEDFEDIQWRYPVRVRGFSGRNAQHFCNGIRIGESKFPLEKELTWPSFLKQPQLSIFDPNGKLPLNLQRSNLTRPLQFGSELLEDICKDLIAFLLVHTPEKPPLNSMAAAAFLELSYQGLIGYRRPRFDWFWCTAKGLSLATKYHLRHCSPRTLYLVPHLSAFHFEVPAKFANLAFFEHADRNLTEHDPWIRSVMTGEFGYDKNHWLRKIKVSGRRVLISSEYENRINDFRVIPKTFLSKITREWNNKDWLVLCTHGCPEPSLDFSSLVKKAKPQTFAALGEWYFDTDAFDSKKDEAISVLEQVWKETIGDAIIPFDLTLRKKLLAHAFNKLSDYVQLHQVTIDTKREEW